MVPVLQTINAIKYLYKVLVTPTGFLGYED